MYQVHCPKLKNGIININFYEDHYSLSKNKIKDIRSVEAKINQSLNLLRIPSIYKEFIPVHQSTNVEDPVFVVYLNYRSMTGIDKKIQLIPEKIVV